MSQSPEIKVEVESMDDKVLKLLEPSDDTLQSTSSVEEEMLEIPLPVARKRTAASTLDLEERDGSPKKEPRVDITQTSPAPSLSHSEECTIVKTTDLTQRVAKQRSAPTPDIDGDERVNRNIAPTEKCGHARDNSIPNATRTTPAAAADIVNNRGLAPSARYTPLRQPYVLENPHIAKLKAAYLLIGDVANREAAVESLKDVDIDRLQTAHQLIADVVGWGEAKQSRMPIDITELKTAHVLVGNIIKSQKDIDIIKLRAVRGSIGDVVNRGGDKKLRRDTGTSMEETSHGHNSPSSRDLKDTIREVFVRHALARDKGL